MKPAVNQSDSDAPAALAEVIPSLSARLDEVLSREGSPQSSNYEAMCEGIQMVTGSKPLTKPCPKCRGTGFKPFTKRDFADRQRRIDEFTEAIGRTESEEHADRMRSHKRKMLEEFQAGDWCPKCSGTGWKYTAEIKPLAGMWNTAYCWRCRGCGEELGQTEENGRNRYGEEYTATRRTPGTDTSHEHEDICLACGIETIRKRARTPRPLHVDPSGPGYYVPVTAKPKGGMAGGSSWSGASSTDNPLDVLLYVTQRHTEVDAHTHVEYGRVLRVVDTVRKENAVIAAAIEAWHGPEADRWKLHKWGRAFTLWPLTKAGAQLARDGARNAAVLLSDLDRIASERQSEEALASKTGRTVPSLDSARRRALIREADQQARALEGLMHAEIARVGL